MPASEPARTAEKTAFGKWRLARRSASATLSNQVFFTPGPSCRRPQPNRDRNRSAAAVTGNRRGTRPGGSEQGRLAVTVDALRVGSVERDAGEELRRHATALACVVGPARRTRSGRTGLAQLGEQCRLPPHRGEAA